jgi:hypothetical protein
VKYLFKLVWLLVLVAALVVCYAFFATYFWLLYPLYYFRWHPHPCDWIPERWAEFLLEAQEFWRGSEGPLFYPGWTVNLTDEEVGKKISSHYASYLAYCKQERSYNPR